MTKIHAHRGASAERPENTMAAFRRAKEMGAYGIEMDVHLLNDGTLAVHHDADLGRCDNTTGRITSFDYNTIRSFSVGEKFAPEYKDERVPYFTELLDYLQENPIFLNCEIKSLEENVDHIAVPVLQLLEAYHMSDKCIISCFNQEVLVEIKEKFPQYKVGWLTDGKMERLDYCIEHHFEAVHPYYEEITPEYVKYAHDHGILVNVWTVDKEEDIRRMKDCGVDIVISNDVATAQKVLGK